MAKQPETTVLIVEDERALAETYAEWLEGYGVRTATTGEAALSALDGAVDVVLLDRRLPGTNSEEVLAAARRRGLDCRVAVITAVEPDFDIVDMDVDDYAIRPILKQELRTIVDRLDRVNRLDEKLRRSYALASKLAILEREKTPEALEASEDYRRLKARYEELHREIDAGCSRFETDEFGLAYDALATDGGRPIAGDGSED